MVIRPSKYFVRTLTFCKCFLQWNSSPGHPGYASGSVPESGCLGTRSVHMTTTHRVYFRQSAWRICSCLYSTEHPRTHIGAGNNIPIGVLYLCCCYRDTVHIVDILLSYGQKICWSRYLQVWTRERIWFSVTVYCYIVDTHTDFCIWMGLIKSHLSWHNATEESAQMMTCPHCVEQEPETGRICSEPDLWWLYLGTRQSLTVNHLFAYMCMIHIEVSEWKASQHHVNLCVVMIYWVSN